MNKGLEALEKIKSGIPMKGSLLDDCLCTIETELKRLEEKEHNLKVEMKVNAGLVK